MRPLCEINECRSASETAALASKWAHLARPGDVFALTGPLGAGKTLFCQGFARGLGYEQSVTSPTFTLMHVYEGGRLPLYHFDLYRLPAHDESLVLGSDTLTALEGIGYEDYWYADGVCLIEWADRAADLLPPHTKWVEITPDYNKSPDHRRITIKESGVIQ